MSLVKRYDLQGVPTLAVDGKYMIGGLEGTTMIQVLDYLIDQVRQEKSAATSE